MNNNATDNYLVTEVMTATPQKLQLMLIDAAIRSAQRALAHWQAQEDLEAERCIIRAQQIVGEMLAALDHEVKSDLLAKVAGVYLFVFRTLMDAGLTRDAGKVNEALRVLAVERETWRQVCEKLAVSQGDWTPTQTTPAPLVPHVSSNNEHMPEMPSSLSLEA